MLNEKHNDGLGWKNKLEGLTGLPGERALEKNAAWEKLHSRLQEKPRKHKAVWYWAAACLLTALSIPLIIVNKKENIVVKNNPPQKLQAITLSMPTALPVTVQAPGLVEKKKVENNTIKENQVTTIKNHLIKDEPLTVIAETMIEKDPVNIITDTATTMAVSIPVKKKLSVVHINELETPSAQFFTTPDYTQKSFKIKFRSGKAANQSFASQQQYEGGFKINLSPKN